MTNKILLVDDEPNVLNGLRRSLRGRFQIASALSGREGLDLLRQKGPFAVVVADMRMPEMNGIEFLRSVQEVSPLSIRLMLTGNADQQTAIDAVNKGNVFRFLTKPCPIEQMELALSAALEQYRLIQAERELLDGTVNGSVRLLTEILHSVTPQVFDRSQSLRKMAVEVAKALQLTDTWDMEMAAMLSHIAHLTLPPETLEKVHSGAKLSPLEEEIVERLPETGYKLLENIPRLEKVAKIVRYQNKSFDGSGFPNDGVVGNAIPLESRILKALHDFKRLGEQGMDSAQAIEEMGQIRNRYDPKVLQAVASYLATAREKGSKYGTRDIVVRDLQQGYLLDSNITTISGQLLLTAGRELTSAMVAKLIHIHSLRGLKEPIRVSIPVDHVSS